MKYSLESFPQISPEIKQALSLAKIDDSDQLLNETSLPEQRKQLSKKTGICENDITLLAGVADLVRIKGIGPVWAWHIVFSKSARNVQEFINQFQISNRISAFPENHPEQIAEQKNLKTARDILSRMKNELRGETGKTRFPTPRQIIEAVDEARELRPRLVMMTDQPEISFDQYLKKDEKISNNFSRTSLTFIFGFLVCTVLIIVSYGYISLRADWQQLMVEYGYLTRAVAELNLISLNLFIIGFISLFLIILLFLVILIFFYEYIDSRVIKTRLLKYLFDRPGHRETYQKITSMDHAIRRKYTRFAFYVFIVMGIILVIVTFRALKNNVSEFELLRQITWVITCGGIVFVFIISTPSLLFFRDLKFNQSIEQKGLQNYLIYLMTRWISLFILISLLFYMLPVLFSLHRNIYRTYILPPFEKIITEKRLAFINAPIISEQIQEFRTSMLKDFDTDIYNHLENHGCVSEEQGEEFENVFVFLSSFWVPVGIIAILLLFIIPYLLFGGVKKGILYMLILFVSFIIENILQTKSAKWLRLDDNSILFWFVFALGVFSSALFLDWLFEIIADPSKHCPNCNADINNDSTYCPHCGLVQSYQNNPTRTMIFFGKLRNLMFTKLKFINQNVEKIRKHSLPQQVVEIVPLPAKNRTHFVLLQSLKPAHWALIYFLLIIIVPLLVWKVSDIYFAENHSPGWLPAEMKSTYTFPVFDIETPVGMVKIGDVLWILNHPGWITKIDIKGQNEKSFKVSCKSCAGITFDGKNIWYADVDLGNLFQLDPASLKSTQKLPLPGKNKVVGLAWDGKYLWVSTQDPSKILSLDPDNGKIVSQIPGPVFQNDTGETLKPSIWDLDFDNNVLLATTRQGDILEIDPLTGNILQRYTSKSEEWILLGIDRDNSNIWTIDYLGRIYQLILRAGGN
jgi:hypothetical protein